MKSYLVKKNISLKRGDRVKASSVSQKERLPCVSSTQIRVDNENSIFTLSRNCDFYPGETLITDADFRGDVISNHFEAEQKKPEEQAKEPVKKKRRFD